MPQTDERFLSSFVKLFVKSNVIRFFTLFLQHSNSLAVVNLSQEFEKNDTFKNHKEYINEKFDGEANNDTMDGKLISILNLSDYILFLIQFSWHVNRRKMLATDAT